jgi:bifunctional UDP-N-acetylglucosamine pyrophosphorylase / glucosamine-1-phosphate N-acetyltransferase
MTHSANPPLHVVVLAAGGGTRMKSSRPKVLQELAGKSMLAHVIDAAQCLAPEQIHVVYGHKGTQVREAFAERALHWVEQTEQLGTGHAVKLALAHIPDAARVLVLYGDSPALLPATLMALVALNNGAGLSVLISDVASPAGLGRVQLNPAQTHVLAIVEAKDATESQRAIRLVNTGVLAADSTTLRAWLAQLTPNNQAGEYYLTQIFEFAAHEQRPACALLTGDPFEGFGANDAWELAQLERYLQARTLKSLCVEFGLRVCDPARVDVRCTHIALGRDVTLDVNVILAGDIDLGDDVHIGPFCQLRNCQLAPGTVVLGHCDLDGVVTTGACRIGPFARLRPGTVLSAGTHVGNFVEIKKSTLGPGSKANHLSYLGDAVIGAQVNIGAGTITCNYDGVNKFTTHIEDGVFVGSNSALVAPIRLQKNATIGAGSTISKDADPDALTLARARQVTLPGWKRPKKQP